MKIFRLVGILVYSSIAGYLIYLLFWGLVNLMVWANLGWIGIIVCAFTVLSLIASLVGTISVVIVAPLFLLKKDSRWMGYFAIPSLILYGYLTISMMWQIIQVFNAKTIIQSSVLSIMAFIVFFTLVSNMVTDKGK